MKTVTALILTGFGHALWLAAPASAQPLGSYRWQLQPYCNVVSLAVTQNGGIYTLDGTDDQCGSAPAAATGEAFLRSGTEAGLRTALECAGFEATVLELSWYGTRLVSLPLGEAFHSRRLTLRSSQVGHIPRDRGARWDHRRRLTAALALLLDPRLDALISGESSFEELPVVMAKLSRDPAGALCHLIRYSHPTTEKA